jgi:flagellar biosynthetic protein FliR
VTLDIPLPVDIVGYAALVARIGGFLVIAPVVGSRAVPVRWRVLFSVMTALAVASALPAHWQTPRPDGPLGLPYLAALIGSEVLLGLVVSLLVHTMFEIFSFAGHVIGINMGFAFAQQIDPTLEIQSSMVSVFMTQMFTIVFVVSGGIDLLLQLAVLSVHRIPPGGFSLGQVGTGPLITAVGRIFATGFELALPIFCVTMFINVALALMTRFGEELQVLMLAFPVRIAVGFYIVFATVPLWVHLAGRLVRQAPIRLTDIMPPA